MAQVKDLIVSGASRFLNTINGTITSAEKLTNTSKIGDTNKPVYFTANGVPSAISYTIDKSVPSTAVFTDTTYTLSADTTNNKIKITPSSGSAQSITVPYATSAGSATSATTAGNVTGTVAIANGGTGATTRLGAAKALTDETVATPGYVVGLTDSWGKFGYTSIANLKTTLGAMTPASHTHGNIQNGGTLQTTDITIASGDKLVVTDSSDSSKIARTSISFDGSTTTKCLTQKGTWESFGTSNLTIGTTASTAMAGNTNVNNVTQTASLTDSTEYGVLLTSSASDSSNHTEGARKSQLLTFSSVPGRDNTNQGTLKVLNNDGYYTWGMKLSDCDIEIINDEGTSMSWDGTNTSLSTSLRDKLSKTGGTMTGTIITPANDSKGIEPATGNYGYVGSSSKYFYNMYSTNYSGSNLSLYPTLTTTTNSKKMTISSSDIVFGKNGTATADTWDGTNTSLVTALANKMTNQVQSAQVSVSVLSNNIMMYKCGRIVYFSIVADFNASLPSKVTTSVGSITASDWRPIAIADSGLAGHNNQISMSIKTDGTVTMYNYTTAAISSGWFRWTGCYITAS